MRVSAHELSLIGAALYLCEGTKERLLKKGGKIFAVEFTNTDPRAIKMFLRFLRKIVGSDEDRIKAELFLYPDLNEDKLKKFWSKVTKIPLNRFQKTIFLKKKVSAFKANPLGTMKIRYSHKEHFLKIKGIINKVFGLGGVA
ncbi:MAG: hypothetical protein UR42_C0015G0012 [Candidatus Roizmanbacteria bacterium GW2011_GWA2_33_33]|uniref:Uncharacterized protein n=1 Tax=Candidatus Roizmanbacteria bacterium GW2011_GWA2_33_33 TaxID=1618476 RepID=A0A0G0A466_9BACT|nr:MAG: hypothetical protein UR42_C0015G0012 [Candidatus Roizmanbacteria bacterium GW2011_GWA2_33_33]